ncbi:MAG TPA: hypothetical protein VMW38_17095 [Terriglobia bacterium]|nr:hypothetical protein [Terriglobia bacterium]
MTGRGYVNKDLRVAVKDIFSKDPSCTLAEVSRRLGVSRQRVGQIVSIVFPTWNGRARRREATVCRRVKKIATLKTFVAINRSCPFPVNLVYRKPVSLRNIATRRVNILGRLCRIVKVGQYESSGYYWLRTGPPEPGVEYTLAVLPDGRVMVIPNSMYRKSMFVLGEKKKPGANDDFHGWDSLVGAWDLLKE